MVAKLIDGKYFIEPGDLVEANCITLEFINGSDNYKISDMSDAELGVWVEEDEKCYPLKYAFDLPKSDPNRGKPYYVK